VITASREVADKWQASDHSEEIRRISLYSLSPEEVEDYIDHRLRLGGWRGGSPFTKPACRAIADRSSANPSAINHICFELLQALAERNGQLNAKTDKELAIDESHLNLKTSRPQSHDFPRSHGLARRRVMFACLGLVLVMGMAGVWYRDTIESRLLKSDSLEITKKVDALMSFAGWRSHHQLLSTVDHDPQAPYANGNPAIESVTSQQEGNKRTEGLPKSAGVKAEGID
jgi:hypothetical protein